MSDWRGLDEEMVSKRNPGVGSSPAFEVVVIVVSEEEIIIRESTVNLPKIHGCQALLLAPF